MKRLFLMLTFSVLLLAGCAPSNDVITIYSNSDQEVIELMTKTLDEAGYASQYEIQTFGSGDLMAKLQIEQDQTNADIVMLSSFYLNSLDAQNPELFTKLTVDNSDVLEPYTSDKFYPMVSLIGTIFYDEVALKQLNLDPPTSYKDLANPEYASILSVPDIASSTTGWLLVQAIVENYDEKTSSEIISQIKINAENQLESSGSGPIKKVDLGEAAIGFGLKHQVINKESIKTVDAIEGNYTISESIGVINNDDQALANEMVEVLVTNMQEPLLELYPVALRKDDVVAAENDEIKFFNQPLTDELLKEHISLWESK